MPGAEQRGAARRAAAQRHHCALGAAWRGALAAKDVAGELEHFPGAVLPGQARHIH
jgi:hypothetical protein